MDLETLAAIVRCRRLKWLGLGYTSQSDLASRNGLAPQDLVMLLDVLWGLYGGGPFDMVLDAFQSWLKEEARAVAVSKGWCAEGGDEWKGIQLRWGQP